MLPEDVLAQIPEEYRDNEALKQFNDIGALAKSYVETKALQGQSIRIPPESAGPEAKAEYRAGIDEETGFHQHGTEWRILENPRHAGSTG